MKTLKKYWAVLMLTCLAFGLAGTEKAMAHGGTGVSFQTFYDELTPYGRWINYPGHGYVWAPDVEAGFQPYATRGHWVMTDYGNTWVSDYAWGWAPFHYGRWLWDDYYGWVWVPGTEWGPAWVSWRTGADYYGWAPLGPGVHININISIPVAHWVFVPQRHIMSRRIYNYCVPRTTVVNVYNNTTIINNYYNYDNRTYVYGPRAQEIEQHTRSRVPVHRVNQDSRPGRAVVDNGAVRMYRPDVTAQRNEVPSRVVTRENFSRPERGGTGNTTTPDRIDRSSYSGTSNFENRLSNKRDGSTEAGSRPARERLSESRRLPAGEATAPETGAVTRERSTQNRLGQARERYSESSTAPTTGSDYSRREGLRERPTTGTTSHTERMATPAPERMMRQRAVRTDAPAERPATVDVPARSTVTAPERSQYNPVMRQEQPAGRPAQPSGSGTDFPQRVRQQSHSQPVPSQAGQETRQAQPQRPQRQEPSGSSIPERRSRSSN